MNSKFLNFGCGNRTCPEPWVNIDFHSCNPHVIQCNLLKGFPFQDSFFDAVYSSHVLEHFSPQQAAFLLAESYRVLKPGGIIRIVVPDLEMTCREYVRIMDAYENDALARRQHQWILIELMDQMVRTTPSGQVPQFKKFVQDSQDEELKAYIVSRTQSASWEQSLPRTLSAKIKNLSIGKIREKLIYLYLRFLRLFYPPTLRSMALDDAPLGEKHRWMYDKFSLREALYKAGFQNPQLMRYDTSQIREFNDCLLDKNEDGSSYKNNSIYMEAKRPS